jgi:polyisoprenoid-binding protein YceI
VKRRAQHQAIAPLAAAVAALLAAAPGQAAEYRLDPTHTTVHVEIDTPGGLSAWRLRLDKPEGTLEFDRAARSGRFDVSVPAAGLTSGSAAVDAPLRALLDPAAHERIRFSGNGLRFEGDRVVAVEGTLVLKGREHPLVLKATRFDCYTSPLFRREVCGGDFEAQLDRAALGLGSGSARLFVQVEALRS